MNIVICMGCGRWKLKERDWIAERGRSVPDVPLNQNGTKGTVPPVPFLGGVSLPFQALYNNGFWELQRKKWNERNRPSRSG